MHVRVDVGGRHVDAHHHQRKAIAGEQRPVRRERGLQQCGVTHGTAVDDDDDIVAAAAREIGRAREAVNANPVLAAIDAHETLRDGPAPDRGRPLAHVLRRGGGERGPPVVRDAELDGTVRQ